MFVYKKKTKNNFNLVLTDNAVIKHDNEKIFHPSKYTVAPKSI